ncbi:hypothetical protein QYF61_000378 [Mycteria americana]|uniref:Fibronectin type-III domain-containing protein n=1 Tax=Mycteria americana TaxID=33587 RepID=A0AAN7NMF2_MYCAM|nr:hypothetical protein QYF61_000378 [Mycteria americana]
MGSQEPRGSLGQWGRDLTSQDLSHHRPVKVAGQVWGWQPGPARSPDGQTLRGDKAGLRSSQEIPDSAPENITYRNISSMEIELSFFPPSIPNGIIQTYTIYLKRTNGTEQRVINTTLLTLHLKKYTEYTVEVSASTTVGEGLRSAPLRILTDEDAPSSPPESLSVKQLSGVTVKLSWKPPLEPNGIILYYTVYVWNKTSKRSVNVTETSLQFTDLENNYEYSAYLTASTRFGDGNIKSDTITFITSEGAPSDPPKAVVYRNLTSTSIMLFWSPPQKPNGNILYYSVYFKNNSGIFIQVYMKNHTAAVQSEGLQCSDLGFRTRTAEGKI